MGINVNRAISVTFFLAGVMASTAGLLIGMKFSQSALGGLGPTVLCGGPRRQGMLRELCRRNLIGLLETFGAGYISSNSRTPSHSLLVLVLLFLAYSAGHEKKV